MKIIVDAMGGDNAPLEIVKGALQAQKRFGADIVFTGDEAAILDAVIARMNGLYETIESTVGHHSITLLSRTSSVTVSQASLMPRPVRTTRKTLLTNALPCLIAVLAPTSPPVRLAAAITSATRQITCPWLAKTTMAATLVVRFASLVRAEAVRNS